MARKTSKAAKASEDPQEPAQAAPEPGAEPQTIETPQLQDDTQMARAVQESAQAPVTVDANAAAHEQAAAAQDAAPDAPVRKQDDPWARPISRLQTGERPRDDAFAANLDGRQVVSPLQGFGQLWQRTYRVRLTGVQTTPEEVMATWKAHFPSFQPASNRFYPTSAGIKPGHMVYIDSKLMEGPGMSQMTEIASGVLVIYSDPVSFTVMTPEGFPVSGWNTFGAYEEDGAVVAQVQGLERATDPIYEFGYRFLGGERKQDKTWTHVLRSLAAHHGIVAEVQSSKTLVDGQLQWSKAGNVWHNAAIRTMLFRLTWPLRMVRNAVIGKPESQKSEQSEKSGADGAPSQGRG